MATVATAIEAKNEREERKGSLAYGALLLFTFLYYTRPEDLIPGMSFIPLEKIIGGIALLAVVVTAGSPRKRKKLPAELKVLFVLFVHLVISIPFAYWRGGAFATVFGGFAKGVTVALLVTLIIDNFSRLRKLFWVQAASLVVTTIASIAIHHTTQGRLIGALGGIFENPNDLAINIAINLPLCLAFLVQARGVGRKSLWTLGILAMLLGVVLTYSRSGLLALITASVVCLWKFGIRARRFELIAAALLLAIVSVGVIFGMPHYIARVQSIFSGNIEDSGDRGSWEARRMLLVESIQEAVHHPIFGIGAGNFGAATRTWHVTHNTYTEFAAEGGFPALILYLIILFLAFKNLRRARESPAYRADPDVRAFTDAWWASLAAFLVGSFFASFEYELFPYFMLAYTSVLYRLTQENASQRLSEAPAKQRPKHTFWGRYSPASIER